MSDEQPNNPLHGLTLETILARLVERYGWGGLAMRIAIRCFEIDPSVKSSLIFLRRTPWAREKLERLYIHTKFKSPVQRPEKPKAEPENDRSENIESSDAR